MRDEHTVIPDTTSLCMTSRPTIHTIHLQPGMIRPDLAAHRPHTVNKHLPSFDQQEIPSFDRDFMEQDSR